MKHQRLIITDKTLGKCEYCVIINTQLIHAPELLKLYRAETVYNFHENILDFIVSFHNGSNMPIGT